MRITRLHILVRVHTRAHTHTRFLCDKQSESRKLPGDFQSVGVKMEWLQSSLYSSLVVPSICNPLVLILLFFVHLSWEAAGEQTEWILWNVSTACHNRSAEKRSAVQESDLWWFTQARNHSINLEFKANKKKWQSEQIFQPRFSATITAIHYAFSDFNWPKWQARDKQKRRDNWCTLTTLICLCVCVHVCLCVCVRGYLVCW